MSLPAMLVGDRLCVGKEVKMWEVGECHYQGDSTLLCLFALGYKRLQFNQLKAISATFSVNGIIITLSPCRTCFQPGWVGHT